MTVHNVFDSNDSRIEPVHAGASDGPATLDFYGMEDQVAVDIIVLIAMVVFYRGLTYLILEYSKGNTSL